MAVSGHYMAWRVRGSAIPYVKAYGEFVLKDVLSAFANLGNRADEIAKAEFNRLASELVGEESSSDMASLAESAFKEGLAFYETRSSLRQTILNLLAEGLFHLIEQHLADLCHDETFSEMNVPPPRETNLESVRKWYQAYFYLDLSSLPSWRNIDELRLVANATKHGKGHSADELLQVRPDLFQLPPLPEEIPLNISSPHISEELLKVWMEKTIVMPLAGPVLHGLYVTEQLFGEYYQSGNQLFADIANHFEAHGEKYYPFAG